MAGHSHDGWQNRHMGAQTWQSKEAEEIVTLQGTHHEGEKTLILCLPQYDGRPLMTMNEPAKEDEK